jgi:hypothetical protein
MDWRGRFADSLKYRRRPARAERFVASARPESRIDRDCRVGAKPLDLDPWARLKGMTKLQPTGECWCGCGESTSRGAFFAPGHDKRAEAAIVKVEYGSVPDLLDDHGYGPGKKNAAEALRTYQEEGGEYL